MKPMRFIVVGSGWRSLFFARIAQAYPEWFELSALLCRTREKADALSQKHGIKTTVSEQECQDMQPDFVVVAVDKASICDVTLHWVAKGYPVLCETPAAVELEDLNRLWKGCKEQGYRIQVAEQYMRYPVHAAGIALMERGYVGEPYMMDLSMVHEYHGASLIRHYLGTGLEGMKIFGKQYEYPVMETDSRDGAITDGRITKRSRVRLTFEYESGKTAFYDFSGVQYHSYIRSRRLQVQGERGELNDQVLSYVKEEHGRYLPETAPLTLCQTEDGRGIARVQLGEQVLYENPFGNQRGLPQDETAIASMMLDMKAFIEDGIPVYPLEEALQDAYVRILMEKALERPGQVIESERQIWSV